MAKLVWDELGKKLYETGTDRAVLYPQEDNGTYGTGVAWNGLTGVTQSPSGAEATPLYANNRKYLELYSAEEFGCSIEAYTYPDEFAACNGEAELVAGSGVTVGQQPRKAFGFTYRTIVGNDVLNNKYGYKIHIVYGARAGVSEKAHTTINDSPEAVTFSWECTTTPIAIEGFEPTAYICVDSTKVDAAKLAAIETLLYGDDSAEPTLPLPSAIIEILGDSGN